MLVGQENAGWRLITAQLNHERVMLGPASRIAGIYDRVHEWASKPGGNVDLLDHDDVRRLLGEIKAIWRINELFNWQVAASGDHRHRGRRCHQGVFDRADPAHRPVGRGDRRQVRQPCRVADRRTAGVAGLGRPSATW